MLDLPRDTFSAPQAKAMATQSVDAKQTRPFRSGLSQSRTGWARYLIALLVAVLCGFASWGLSRLGIANGFLVFLVGISVVAVSYGTGPSITTSIASTGILAYFFMPPIFSFAVSDIQHVFALTVMITISIVISNLTSRVLHHEGEAKRNAERFESLYRLSRDLADVAGAETLARAAVKHIESVFGATAVVLLADEARGFAREVRSVLGNAPIRLPNEYGDGFRAVPMTPLAASFRGVEWSAARAAFETQQIVGLGTYSTPHATALFVPLTTAQSRLGVLAVRPAADVHAFTEDQREMLTTLAGQVTSALERDRLSQQVRTALDAAETERMRSALLSSVSHDLRTPLAAIAGSSSSLLADAAQLPMEVKRELYRNIFDNADRLSRIVENLLNMTRIESGLFRVAKQQHVLEEVVGSTLRRMNDVLKGRKVETHIPVDLPLVPLDDVLFQQVLANLIDNAQKYAPGDAPIELDARADERRLTIDVNDRGPGLPIGEEERVFEKFYRGPKHRHDHRGTGLGLTICRAITAAHGGTITGTNREGGGSRFRVVLPLAALGEATVVDLGGTALRSEVAGIVTTMTEIG